MTDRFTIKDSAIVQDGYFIKDEENTYTFPTTTDGSHLLMYRKALNELNWSKQLLETQILHIKEDKQYYKTKCGSLEEELLNLRDKHRELKKQVNDTTVAVEVETCKVMEKVFELIDKKIEEETCTAEKIESVIEGDYICAVNRLTIAALENLKQELKNQ